MYADAIRQLRHQHGLTRTELAIIAGVAEHTIGQWERNQQNISMRFRRRLAQHFDAWDMFDLDPPAPETPPEWFAAHHAELMAATERLQRAIDQLHADVDALTDICGPDLSRASLN